jgi:hypothetical protein
MTKVFQGEAPPALAEEIVSHLVGCRECSILAARAIAEQEEIGPLVAEGPLGAVVELYRFEQNRLEERLEAQAAWLGIRPLGPKERRDKVRLTRTLHTRSFLEILMFESRQATNPRDSEEFAYLALLVTHQLPQSKFAPSMRNDLAAECCAQMANARRHAAKWEGAKEVLTRGTEHLKKGSGDRRLEGQILCVAGALEGDLGHRGEAAERLKRALQLFESSQDWLLVGRTMVQLANIVVHTDPEASLTLAERALVLIPPRHQRIRMFAECVRVESLIELGAHREAMLRFDAIQDVFEQFKEPRIQLRRQFTNAQLLEGFGHVRKAEALIQEVIEGDLEHGLMKDLFLDLIYLVGLHLREGDSAGAADVCNRALRELELMAGGSATEKAARGQMKEVWSNLLLEVKRGTITSAKAAEILRDYVQTHWRTPAAEIPVFKAH